MKLSRYTIFHEEDGKVYIYNQLSEALLEIDGELSGALRCGLDAVPDEIVSTLSANGFLVEDDACESDAVCYANMRNRFNSKCMRVTVLPTINCNFRCWYCYEHHKPMLLSDEDAQAMLRFIKAEVEEKHLEKVVLDWFGGEPLIRFRQTVYPVSKDLKEWCGRHGVEFVNMMTTNGSLIDEDVARMMNEIELRNVQITLDGGKEKHNEVRFSPAIKDSYTVIVRNIHLLCRTVENMSVELRINYTRDNIDSAFGILDSFDDDVRHRILVSPHIVWQEAGSMGELSPKVEALKEKAFGMGLSVRGEGLMPRCATCYTDNMEQFVINHDLSVYKCTARDFDGKYSIGRITAEGKFEPNNFYYKYYTTPSPFMRNQCLECELLPTCLYSLSCIQKKIEGCSPECNKESVLASLRKSLSYKIRKQ